LTIQFYIQAQKKRGHRGKIGEMTAVELTIAELLEASEIALAPSNENPENPSRTRKMIEEAFKLLHKHKVVGSYGKAPTIAPEREAAEQRRLRLQQERDTQKRIDECAQGWWKLYMQQRWRFEPPSLQPNALLPETTQNS
jgi:hypothetical protein